MSSSSGAYSGPTGLFVNNQFIASVSGKTFGTFNPASGKEICQVSEGDKADIDVAVAAADKAFVKWRRSTGEARSKLMHALADLVEKNLEVLASTESLDNGMHITMSRAIVGTLPLWLRHFAGYADKLHGSTTPLPNPTQFSFNTYEPIGVVGAIVP